MLLDKKSRFVLELPRRWRVCLTRTRQQNCNHYQLSGMLGAFVESDGLLSLMKREVASLHRKTFSDERNPMPLGLDI